MTWSHKYPAQTSARWTPEQDQQIRARYDDETAADIAELLGRTKHAVKQRAAYLGLHKYDRHHPKPHTDLARQDQDFINAMVAAIRRRDVIVPGIGIDQRPCTRSPVFVPHHAPSLPTTSSAAECCDY